MFGLSKTALRMAVAVVVLIVLASLLALCSGKRQAERNAETVTEAREADAEAIEARQQDQAAIANDTRETRDDLAKLPDANISDHDRVRACRIWMRQRPNDPAPASCPR